MTEPAMPTKEVDLEALKMEAALPKGQRPPTRRRRKSVDADSSGVGPVATEENNDGDSSLSGVIEAGEKVAKAAQKGAARKTKPTDENWYELLIVVIGYFSLLTVWWLTAGTGIKKSEREELEVNDDEADAIARPLSRILARSTLNTRYGHQAMGFTDYILLMAALTMYAQRLAPRIQGRVKEARNAINNNRNQSQKVPKETTNNNVATHTVDESSGPIIDIRPVSST